ncbi:MAG TPA: HAD family hydrolase [Flavisolibacter sp.]|nr:HAD family hydrolase [Flavisolibacter sp.]
MKKRIAFFDFDGTITTKDTLLEFIKFSRGRSRFYLGFLLYSPYLVAYKLKLIPNQLAKEKVLRFFFSGMPVDTFRGLCEDFSVKALPALIRPKAVEEIRRLQRDGATVVIVSASPENWISYWASSLGLQLLGSRLEVKDGRLTGKILGSNCHGNEKVRRIEEKYDLSQYGEIYAYGDTSGDKPMLRLASSSFFKPFRS